MFFTARQSLGELAIHTILLEGKAQRPHNVPWIVFARASHLGLARLEFAVSLSAARSY